MNESKPMASNPASLPPEIIIDILSRLPVKTLLRLRSVCKLWKSVIADAYFIRKQFFHMSSRDASHHHLLLRNLTLDRFEIITLDFILGSTDCGSLANPPRSILQFHETLSPTAFLPLGPCNGLIFLSKRSREEMLLLWNPSTREIKILPDHPLDVDQFTCAYNFGYDSLSNDYKVLVTSERQAALYSLREDSWRRVPGYSYDFKPDHDSCRTFCKNAFSWPITAKKERGWKNFILFDLGNESFRVLPLPAYKDLADPLLEFTAIGGDLCATYDFHSHVDIWVTKELGVKDSWVKICTFPKLEPLPFPRALCMWGDEIVLESLFGVVIYSRKNGMGKVTAIKDVASFGAYIYMESLVSPNGE